LVLSEKNINKKLLDENEQLKQINNEAAKEIE